MKLLPRALRQSLATRILLVFILTCLLITAVILGIVIQGFASQWRNAPRTHIAQYLEYVNEDIGNPPDVERAKELAEELSLNIYIRGLNEDFSSTGRPLDMEDLDFHEHGRRFRKRHYSYDDEHQNNDKRQRDAAKVQFSSDQYRTVVRDDIGPYQIFYELPHPNRRSHRDDVLGKTLLGILSLLGVCFLIFRRMLRPIQDLKKGVEQMGKGKLSYRVPVRADNDLGELASSINTMADDIEKMLDAKRQLLLGVSHELRSPLTRATIATQLLDDSSHVQQIREDLREMDSLLTEILETERINTSHAVIHRSSFDLIDVAQAVLTELTADTVSLQAIQGPMQVNLDEARVRLLLRNLISNALKYGGDAVTPPRLCITENDKIVSIEVSDSGPGISAEHLAQVTEPFYRADPSRTRSTGGFGIGLYLCKLIAEAHQGSLTVSSEPGQGTQVTALLKSRLND